MPRNQEYIRWDVRTAKRRAAAEAKQKKLSKKTRGVKPLPAVKPIKLPRPVPVPRTKVPMITCKTCGLPFKKRHERATYCSRKCRGLDPAERLHCSRIRKDQIIHEEGIADRMRKRGWEIYSPTVVCDRIGVKDDKVYFIDFKRKNEMKLRPGQERIYFLAPRMYRIIRENYY